MLIINYFIFREINQPIPVEESAKKTGSVTKWYKSMQIKKFSKSSAYGFDFDPY